jgi:glycine cleavage system H protein
VVHLEFPTVGKKVAAGQPFGEIESVKSVNDLYSPVGGEVVAVNAQLEGDLGLLGQDPYGAAWIVKIKVSDKSALDKLMDYNTYEASCQSH